MRAAEMCFLNIFLYVLKLYNLQTKPIFAFAFFFKSLKKRPSTFWIIRSAFEGEEKKVSSTTTPFNNIVPTTTF